MLKSMLKMSNGGEREEKLRVIRIKVMVKGK